VRFSKIKLAAERATHAQNSMTHRSNWRLGVLAGAVALLASLPYHSAMALGLGRITVQSALGEALKAEVEVPEINADEAASLRVGVASPAAFKAAGLEYSQAVTGVQVSLQKRADGRSYLSLTSARPVTEPFVDLIIEASWSSGRLVRDYTMLFDPPNLRQSAPVAATAPVVTRQAIASPTSPAAPSVAPARNQAPAAARPQAPAQAAVPKAAIAEKASAQPKPAASGQQVTVKTGDTASKIAAQSKPASISLDQMLVALLKSNPQAFIGGNINRLKSGAVLDIPSADDAGATPTSDASRTIVAQAKDFNDFRQKLASGAPMTQVESANRQTGGKLQAKVDDRATSSVAPDKLTLSKGALQGKAVAEDKIAKDKQAKDASTRVAELSKNIGDLNKIAAAPAAAVTSSAAASPESAAKATGLPIDKPTAIPVPVPAATASSAASAVATVAVAVPALAAATPTVAIATSTTTTTTATAAVASQAASASAPSVATPAASATAAPVASAPIAAKKPVVVAPPPPEPSFIDELTSSDYALPGLAALLALLAGFGFYRYKKRDQGSSVDSSFLESRLQPDSFFGASGGQRIDTNESGSATGSSMVYSPSQLDAAGDVDPVAEADVYLAYGRDLQAEEILKEAMRTHPTRVAIHSKLLEIYAKRRDMKGFEVVAAEAYTLTRGTGSEWAYICELGRDLDPSNPLYQQGGQPQQLLPQSAQQIPAMGASFGADTVPLMTVSSASSQGMTPDVDFDLDLDFSDGSGDAQAAPGLVSPGAKPGSIEPTVAMKPVQEPSFDVLDMDFGEAATGKVNAPMATGNGVSFDIDAPAVATKPVAPVAKPAPIVKAAPAVIDSGMLEFDMSSLSLDLDGPITESPKLSQTAAPAAEGPLEIKFALAEEFRALGDSDGARSLASEVVAQSQGALKTKAQAFLNALS
jgi:pilus assembly protein FimV